MERDEAFQLATGRVLPATIQAELEGPERYAIGNVVYHSAKPTIVSWRKQNVQFATLDGGEPASLSSILEPKYTGRLSRLRPQSTLFSSTGRRDTAAEFRTHSAGKPCLVRASFGAIYQTTSNLLGVLDSAAGGLKVDLGNPVVQRVAENGGRLFVVSTVYEADRVEISVREDSDQGQWRNVVAKTDKTVLGFLLVKLAVSSEGVLQPVWHGGYTPHSISIEESEDGPELRGDLEDVDSDYAYHQCGRRELQVFQSDSYADVIDEAGRYVEALAANRALQSEFIEAVKKPRSALMQLSQELQALQESLVRGSGERGKTSFPELMAQLSTQHPHHLEQVKALGIATEAFKELSPVTSKRILSLTVEEKKMLFDLFKDLPLSSSVHTFSQPAFPDSDQLYSQVLEKIGFGASGGRLGYETDVSGVDLVAVAITAIQASTVDNSG